ncbi:MAG: calcium/sodium antiporter [Eubacterium sp.]|nr:calcium/sodium antiporter [Eubacterium sp.]
MDVLEVLKNVGFIIVGFILLIKGADFFVDGASSVAGKLGIPQIVIGLTIVAFGTSAPEAAISISSAVKGNGGISIGNVVGSNIMNVLLILGLTAVIRTLNIKKSTAIIDIPFMIIVSVLLLVWGVVFGKINLPVGIIFWVLLIGFIVYLIVYSKKSNASDSDVEIKDLKAWQIIIFIVGGIAAIIFGSNLTVDGASYVAKNVFHVSDRIIGLTIVAFGTSLPELMTSVTAARKGNADIAVGNIVGSNIFNILFVLGTSVLIRPVAYEGFTIDNIVAIGAAVLLWLPAIVKRKLGKGAGTVMLLSYAAYFVYLLINAKA